MADEKLKSKHKYSMEKVYSKTKVSLQDNQNSKVNVLRKSNSKNNTNVKTSSDNTSDSRKSRPVINSTKPDSKKRGAISKVAAGTTPQVPQIKKPLNKASSRITTSQYYPKKYSDKNIHLNDTKSKIDLREKHIRDAPDSKSYVRSSRSIEHTNEKIASTKIRSRSRTLKPEEIKLVKGPIDHEYLIKNINSDEKLVDLTNPFDNDIKHLNNDESYKRKSTKSKKEETDSEEYEEDFESYESDFEEYSSEVSSSSSEESSTSNSNLDTISESSQSQHNISSSSSKLLPLMQKKNISYNLEEEKMLDSGHYDLRESKQLQLLRSVQNAIQKENINFVSHREQMETSLSDEGFEDGSLKNTNFINFKNAHKKQQKLKLMEKYIQRGKDLKRMITLDTITINLLDLLPVPYELFMKSYGKKDTFQISSQTNEDDLSEPVQTDSIETVTKWTQFPIEFSNNIKTNENINYVSIYKNERAGVGSDTTYNFHTNELKNVKYDVVKLNKFINKASQVILTLLEELNRSSENKINNTNEKNIFSSGNIKLNTELIPIIAKKPAYLIHYHNKQKHLLMTLHHSKTDPLDIVTTDSEIEYNSIICIWNIFKPLAPWKILITSESIKSCCFDSNQSNIIFAGLENGFLCLWDLREDQKYHKTMTDKVNHSWTLRIPSYITLPGQKQNVHKNEVVSVKCIPYIEEHSLINFEDKSAAQICSLDSLGTIILWSVIHMHTSSQSVSQYPGLAFWGRTRLVATQLIDLNTLFPELCEFLQCYTMQFDSHDSNHIYIVTNTCHILHCLISGSKVTPIHYISNTGNSSWTSYIETLPHKMPLFLVGCKDGTIRLHSGQVEKCLKTFYGMNDLIYFDELKNIQWSKARPCIFYSADEKHIQIWNLEMSDIYPVCSVPYKEKITAMCLLPHVGNKESNLVIATENGDVKLFHMNPDFGYKSDKEIVQELKMLTLYVDRL